MSLQLQLTSFKYFKVSEAVGVNGDLVAPVIYHLVSSPVSSMMVVKCSYNDKCDMSLGINVIHVVRQAK